MDFFVYRLAYPYRGFWVLSIFLVLLAIRHQSDSPVQYFGLLPLACALALRLWAGAHIGGHTNGETPQAPSLATSGPYALNRHPLYWANAGTGLGLLLLANCLKPWESALFLLALIAFYASLARIEEKALRIAYGDSNHLGPARLDGAPHSHSGSHSYSDYRRRVPAWSWSKTFSSQPGDWHAAWARQGRNIVYTLMLALLILLAAAWPPA